MHSELSNFISQCGYPIQDIIPDGALHRFKTDSKDSKESGWYIFFQNHMTKSGQPYFVGLLGNWRTGEKYEYQTQAPLAKEDRDLVRRRIESAKRKVEEEKQKKQFEAKEAAKKVWGSSFEGTTEYCERKMIPKPFGTRVVDHFVNGKMICVPMRDINGELWNLQRIYNDGTKKFMFGGRVEGMHHTLGDFADSEMIYVCEGFATGVSIHEAIDQPVVICFTSHNLITVATELKKKYHDKTIVICGDDDRFNEINTGRERAEEAAKLTLGKAIFPVFKITDEKLTDFNDLYVKEGPERVRDLILGVQVEKRYVLALGYFKDAYYFVSSINQQIQKITASGLSSSGMLRLQPLEYWEVLFPGKKTGVDWTSATSFLIEQCHQKGVFRPENIRGRGVWIDDKRIVYHMGSSLWVNGKEMGLHAIKSKFIYDQDEDLPSVHAKPLTVDECARLVEIFGSLKFKKGSTDAAFLLGWLAIAPICGALPWRPHLWLSGQSGTGKSWIQNDIIKPMLQGMSHFFSGQTTEAGVRQTTGVSSLPVIFDEFETNDPYSGVRVQQVLELARQASSDTEAIVAKGGTSGEAMQFRPRFAMICSSVRVNLKHEEDQNRFTLLELMRHEDTSDKVEHFKKLKGQVYGLPSDFGSRLFSRSIRNLKTILKSREVLMDAFGAKYTMRMAQQMSVLLAGFWSLLSDDVISDAVAQDYAEKIEIEAVHYEDQDETMCLNELLETKMLLHMRHDQRSVTIREVIAMATNPNPNDVMNNNQPYIDVLATNSIIVKNNAIYIAAGSKAISDIYSKTKWAGSFSKILRRIPNARHSVPMKFPKTRHNARCIEIPIDAVLG
jgi:putative DNA primase/helicase